MENFLSIFLRKYLGYFSQKTGVACRSVHNGSIPKPGIYLASQLDKK